jgi:3-phenylpropionate/cinnamic acid dioxygenase small subunit
MTLVTAEQQHVVEQFYYREARLLDNRQFQQWLALADPEILYQMPSRTNPFVDNRQRGREEMISVDRELEDSGSMGCPIREEGIIHLTVRVERAYKMNAWAENPPARTRRLVGNVEVLEDRGQEIDTLNNFHLYFARPGSDNHVYAGQRRDTLRRTQDGFSILRRELVMDYANIELPTLGLLL